MLEFWLTHLSIQTQKITMIKQLLLIKNIDTALLSFCKSNTMIFMFDSAQVISIQPELFDCRRTSLFYLFKNTYKYQPMLLEEDKAD